jgi:hypothetical protein
MGTRRGHQMASKVDSPWDSTASAIGDKAHECVDIESIHADIVTALQDAWAAGYDKAMRLYRNAPPEPGN